MNRVHGRCVSVKVVNVNINVNVSVNTNVDVFVITNFVVFVTMAKIRFSPYDLAPEIFRWILSFVSKIRLFFIKDI